MSEEIKKILDDLKKTADNCVFVVCGSQEELDQMPRYTSNFMSINDRQAKILLKYIEYLQQKAEQLENIRKEAIEYMKSIENEPDADMYMKIGEYNEYKYLLRILNKGDNNVKD